MRRAILILAALVCHAFLRDAQGAAALCEGHACKTNWVLRAEPGIVVNLFGKAGNNAECAIDAARPLEENFIGCVCACAGDKINFRVTASDKDDHVCQGVVTGQVDNFILQNTALSVQITGTGIAATVPLVSDQAGNVASRTWIGSWSVPPQAAGQMLDFQFSGSVADKPCTSHPASNDPDVNLAGYKGQFAVIKVEFDNVWDRNLQHSQDSYPDYKKCIGVQHDASGDLDLKNYLKIQPANLTYNDIKERIALVIDKRIYDPLFNSASIANQTSVLKYYTTAPGDIDIFAYGINLKCAADNSVLDRLITVIYPGASLTAWNNWVDNATFGNNPGNNWLTELPPVYLILGPPNSSGIFGDPEPGECHPQRWSTINASLPAFYHFNASFEMRSAVTAGNHTHQACYDAGGALIVPEAGNMASLASSGTADHRPPSYVSWDHWNHDVAPFIRAAQMDGNPIDGFRNLNHPLIRIGPYLQIYYNRRPAHTAHSVLPGCCDTNICVYH